MENNHKFICTKNLVLDDGIILILKGDVAKLDSFDVGSVDLTLIESVLCPNMEVSIDTKKFSKHFDVIRN